MICDTANGSVNRLSCARCHIRKSGYTGYDPWTLHHNNSQNTSEQYSNAIIQEYLDLIDLSLWVQSNK